MRKKTQRQWGKRFILGRIFKRPWHEVVLEWHAKGEFSREEIAQQWTTAAAKHPRGIRYNVHDVDRFLQMARAERERSSERAAAQDGPQAQEPVNA